MEHDRFAELVQEIRDVYEDRSFSYDLAQISAKSLLREISVDEATSELTFDTLQLLKNLTLVTFNLQKISEASAKDLTKVQGFSLEAAKAWEGLSLYQNASTRQTSIINSAILYELAGYQANSVCLIKKVEPQIREREPSFLSVVVNFLLRRFINTRIVARDLAVKAPTGEMDKIAVSAAATGFMHACNYFFSGNEAEYGNALSLFRKSIYFYEMTHGIHESNILHGVVCMLPAMRERSTWNVFKDLDVPADWNKFMKLLARGSGSNILKNHSISELWPSQVSALEGGLFNSHNKIIKMPTSAGKTIIAELAIIHSLMTNPDSKCIYIAPYRALVGEVEQSFSEIFIDMGYKISSILGYSYDIDEFQKVMADDSNLLIVTPEKLDILYRTRQEILKKSYLYIIDEGHILDERERGLKFELLINRIKSRFPRSRFVLLSAVFSKESLQDFAKWFGVKENHILTENWRPSLQRVGSFVWKGDNGHIDLVDGQMKEYVYGVIKRKVYRRIDEGKLGSLLFPDGRSKAQTAAELAWKFSELGSVLVFCSQRRHVRSVGKALLLRLGLSANEQTTIPAHFLPQQTLSIPLAKEWLGENSPVTEFLSRGIGIHYGTMPDVLKRAVEIDFKMHRFKILLATNTLAQGVNLPIRTILVHSCWRGSSPNLHRLSARDYWNIVGRAGRAGEETQGLSVHIIHSQNDRDDFNYFMSHRDSVEKVQGSLFKALTDLVENRISQLDLMDQLDPEILAILAEEKNMLNAQRLADIYENTLVHAQLVNLPKDEKYQDVFIECIEKVSRRILKSTDADHLMVFSRTGLRSTSCNKIKDFVLGNTELVRSFLLSSHGLDEETKKIVDFINSEIQEASSQKDLPVNYIDLLGFWLEGNEPNKIIQRFDDLVKPDELSNYIEESFGTNLPWCIAGFIQIATEMLSINEQDLSPSSRYLPTMIKYGVPNPQASWAISLGIPYRGIAISLSNNFIQGGRSNYDEFVNYLSKISTVQLSEQFNLRSPMLEDVSRTLIRTTSKSDDHSLSIPDSTWIVGIKFGDLSSTTQISKGDEVILHREYNNVVDRNAIRVTHQGRNIGYIDRKLARMLAPELDSGLKVTAYITEIEVHAVPAIKISLESATLS